MRRILVADGQAFGTESSNSAGVTLASAQLTIRVAVLTAIADDSRAVLEAARASGLSSEAILRVLRALAQSA